MSGMEVEVDTGQELHWTVIHTEPSVGDHVEVSEEGPLLVAMQPQYDIPAVEINEIVVVTEGAEEVVETGDSSVPQMVTVAAVEEVVEDVPYRESVEEIETYDDGAQAARLNIYPGGYTKVKIEGQAGLPKGAKIARSASGIRTLKAGLGKGIVASAKAPPPSSSSSESESENTSKEEEEEGDEAKKTPKKREFAHRLQWRDRDMLEALHGVQERKLTIRGAAKRFGVPYSTLKDRVHGRVRHGVKPGVKTALSPEEEDELVKYVKDMEVAGFQLRYIDVRDRAGELLRLNHGHNSPYRDTSPGHNWLAGFLKRHPGLEFKRPSNRSCLPSMTKQKQMLRKYFDIAAHIYKRYRLGHKSDRIFSVSETTITAFPSLSPVTLIIAASADGSVLPPFVVFKGSRLPLASVREAYPEAAFTCSYDGQVNEDIFLWWFRDHFLRRALRDTSGGQASSSHGAHHRKPTVLHMSRWATDVTLQLAQRAKEERVFLVSVPPGVAHLVLPLDVGIAAGLETAAARAVQRWQMANGNTAITHRVCAHILMKIWRKCIGAECVTLNFARNGLFPLNANAISAERIFSAAQCMRSLPQEDNGGGEGDGPHTEPVIEEEEQDGLSGLSLLSALSSHEYVSLDSQNGNRTIVKNENKRRRIKTEAVDDDDDDDGGEERLVRSLLQQQLEAALPEKRQRVSEAEPPPAPIARQLAYAMAEARENPAQVSHAVDNMLGIVNVQPEEEEEDEGQAEEQVEEQVVLEEEIVEVVLDKEHEVVTSDDLQQMEVVEEVVLDEAFADRTIDRKHIIPQQQQPRKSGNWMDVFNQFLQARPTSQLQPLVVDEDVSVVYEEQQQQAPQPVLITSADQVIYFDDSNTPQVVVEECVVEYIPVADGDTTWDGVEETV